MTHAPFTIAVEQDRLDDLSHRLERARFAEPTPGDAWAAGTDPHYLRELVGYWAHGLGRRAHEAGPERGVLFAAAQGTAALRCGC